MSLFSHNSFPRLKTLPLKVSFEVCEQPEVARCRFWRASKMSNQWSAVFGQCSSNQRIRNSRCIVTVKSPVPNCPHFRSFSSYSILCSNFVDGFTTMVLHYLMNISNELFGSPRDWPVWRWFLLNCGLFPLEAISPLLYLCYYHGFIANGLLNLQVSLHLCIIKLVLEPNAVALLKARRSNSRVL